MYVQVVGDDLLVTNPKRVQKGIDEKWCNALLLKVNQIGTVTESIEAVRMSKVRLHFVDHAPFHCRQWQGYGRMGVLPGRLTESAPLQEAGWGVMASHRSGETEDSFIADLAVGLATGQIKTGAPCR